MHCSNFFVIRPPGRRGQAAEMAGSSAFRGIQEEISIDKGFKFAAVQRLFAVSIVFCFILVTP
jgi:hypothetical protein